MTVERERQEAEEATAKRIQEERELDQARRALESAEQQRRDLGETLTSVRTERLAKKRELEAMIQMLDPCGDMQAVKSVQHSMEHLRAEERRLVSQYNEASQSIARLKQEEQVEIHELEMAKIEEEVEIHDLEMAEAELVHILMRIRLG